MGISKKKMKGLETLYSCKPICLRQENSNGQLATHHYFCRFLNIKKYIILIGPFLLSIA